MSSDSMRGRALFLHRFAVGGQATTHVQDAIDLTPQAHPVNDD